MSYIGQTSLSLKKRAGSKGKNYCTMKYFGPAIEEYSWENFKPEVLLTVHSKTNANFIEELMTIIHNTQWPNGYNDRCGCKASELYKKDRSKAMIGHRLSEITKQKKSIAMKKYYSLEENRRKTSEARNRKLLKNKIQNNPC